MHLLPIKTLELFEKEIVVQSFVIVNKNVNVSRNTVRTVERDIGQSRDLRALGTVEP